MQKDKRGKAVFFGFPLSKEGARLVYFVGLGILILTLLSLLYLLYWVATSYAIWQTYVGLGLTGYGLMSWVPYIIGDITFMILGVYMMSVGKKGR